MTRIDRTELRAILASQDRRSSRINAGQRIELFAVTLPNCPHTIILQCGHKTIPQHYLACQPPAIGDPHYCRICRRHQPVQATNAMNGSVEAILQ